MKIPGLASTVCAHLVTSDSQIGFSLAAAVQHHALHWRQTNR